MRSFYPVLSLFYFMASNSENIFEDEAFVSVL